MTEDKAGKVVAVDLDGTLAYYEGWKSIDHIGDPLPGAVEMVTRLVEEGCWVIVFTTRTSTAVNRGHETQALVNRVHTWLRKHRFPYGEVWSKSGKPLADLYIDDRAYRHPCNGSWDEDEEDHVLMLLEDV